MHGLEEEARTFRSERLAETAEARQRAALHLCCGIDLEHLESAGPGRRAEFVSKIKRAIERERLKGTRRHWTYDLNRHIALKQALDRFFPAGPAAIPASGKITRRRLRQIRRREQTTEDIACSGT
jgi:hypothetical protein